MDYKHSQISIDSSANELVTLAELVDWLRIPSHTDEGMVKALITAAHARVEQLINADLQARQYILYLPSGQSTADLPRQHVASIVDVSYYNSSNALSTYSMANVYQVGNWVKLMETPNCYDRPDAIQITYATALPESIKHTAKICVQMLVATWYDNRADGKYAVPSAVEVMCGQIRSILV